MHSADCEVDSCIKQFALVFKSEAHCSAMNFELLPCMHIASMQLIFQCETCMSNCTSFKCEAHCVAMIWFEFHHACILHPSCYQDAHTQTHTKGQKWGTQQICILQPFVCTLELCLWVDIARSILCLIWQLQYSFEMEAFPSYFAIELGTAAEASPPIMPPYTDDNPLDDVVCYIIGCKYKGYDWAILCNS